MTVKTAAALLPAGASTWLADVHYRDMPRLIACALLETSQGLVLVDPGPSVSLPNLEAAMALAGTGLQEVCAVLLTHIHLDHAGATGTIVRANPDVRVYVHGRGAPHVAQPGRLLASVRRIYGDRMDAMFGAVYQIPEANIRVVDGGDRLAFGDLSLQVAYTPGHAIHHVCYLNDGTGMVFAGDATGMRVAGTCFLVPVALPPDIDLEAWRSTLALLRSWDASQLFLTHFGVMTDVAWHLDHAEDRLNQWATAVRATLDEEGDDTARAARFHEQEMAHVHASLSQQDREPYLHMGQPRESWYGLARYWRKRYGVALQDQHA